MQKNYFRHQSCFNSDQAAVVYKCTQFIKKQMKFSVTMDSNKSVGLKKVALKQLEPDLSNAIIVAIIIAKQRPRRFANARANQEKERGVWNFTVRDTPQDYVNVTCWGVADDVFKLNDTFQVGDIVEIIKPRILVRQVGDYGDQFRPMVTSPYTLILQELSEIHRHDGNCTYLNKLLHMPTKPLAGFVTLSDIQSGGDNKSQFVDLLVAVAAIGSIRTVKTKEGIEQQVRDFTVFDHTSPGMRISTWDQEFMTKIGFWRPRSTILFMTDMRIEFNQFHNSLVAVITSRTIITEDPEGPEVQAIRNYAQTAALEATELLDKLVDDAVLNPYNIQNVMSVQQVLDKMYDISNKVSTRTEDRSFTALLYVLITQLDLDGLSRIVSTRCNICRQFLKQSSNTCENQDCPTTVGAEPADLVSNFDIRINLSDHTGTLTNCRLKSQVAENVLNCSVYQFNHMSENEKCRLKWKYLMERCEVRVVVLCVPKRNPLISVLTCSLASPSQVASKLPHY